MKKGFGLVGILITIGVIAILGGGGYYYLLNDTNVVVNDIPEGYMSDVNGNVVEEKPHHVIQDETANWKTYRNEEYGFEFKYPETGNISNEEPNSLRGYEEQYYINIKNLNLSFFISKESFFEASDFEITSVPYESKNKKYQGKIELHQNHQSAKLDSIYISFKILDNKGNMITIRKEVSNPKIKELSKKHISLSWGDPSNQQVILRNELDNYLQEKGMESFKNEINQIKLIINSFEFNN